MKTLLTLILLAGCSPSSVGSLDEAIKSGTFTAGPNLTIPRTTAAYASLQDGRVLIAGGLNDSGSLSSAEVYNPAAHLFVSVGSMSVPRERAKAVLLPSGKVVVLGGRNSTTFNIKQVEIFDPISNTFSPAGNMQIGRSNFTVTLLTDGTILSAGGYATVDANGNPLTNLNDYAQNTAEVYDPTTQTSTLVGVMVAHRLQHASILMLNGDVLTTGGFNFIDNDLASAEIYNHTTKTFSATTGNMSHVTREHAMTLDKSGRPVALGGTYGNADNEDEVSAVSRYRAASKTFLPLTSLCAMVTNFDGVTACHGRGEHSAVTLLNGNTLIVAGYSSEIGWILPAEVFDGSDTAQKGNLILGREFAATALLPDGTVLVAGGDGDDQGYSPVTGALIESEIYHP